MNKICPVCGKSLPDNLHGHSKYCSAECKRAAVNKMARERRANNRVWEYETRECLVCGKKFLARRNVYVFCSLQCRQKYHTVKNARGYTAFTCLMCGKEFFSGGKGPRLYCGDECRKKAHDNYKRDVPRLHKCHNPKCAHKTRMYYCSICRQKMRQQW